PAPTRYQESEHVVTYYLSFLGLCWERPVTAFPLKDHRGPDTGNNDVVIRPAGHLVGAVDNPLDITNHRKVIREKQVVVKFRHLLGLGRLPLVAIAEAQPISGTVPQRSCPPEASRGGVGGRAHALSLTEAS